MKTYNTHIHTQLSRFYGGYVTSWSRANDNKINIAIGREKSTLALIKNRWQESDVILMKV